jgi:urease accessory protein
MQDAESFLAALQLSDSTLPIGRFVHSYGLEAWARHDERLGECLVSIVETVLLEAVAPLDAATAAHAHRAGSAAELAALDRLLTAYKLSESARVASVSCGRQLARLAPRLTEDALVAKFCELVHRRETEGNLALVEGIVGRALGLTCEQTVLVALRSIAVALLSATVRLGRFSALQAQEALRELAPAIVGAAEIALTTPLDALHSGAPELEIYAMSHARSDARAFMT